MFIFHILIVWYYAWIGNLLFGGLNIHSVLYTNWTFTLEFSVSFENVPCKALYSGINGVWNGFQMMWDSFQTSAIIVENLYFLYFWNPSYVRMSMLTHACFGPCTQDATHIRRQRAILIIYFQKNIFAHLKWVLSWP